MSKPEFGTKHVCEACAERFYDLNRSPVICFKCGATQAPPKPRMYRAVRSGSDRGAFGRRPPPILAEEKVEEPVDDLVVEDPETADDDAAEFDDDADEVEIEVDIDPEDDKVVA